jgi:hypothetical protein
MQWSKLKTRAEAFFAPAVAGRVELRITQYRTWRVPEGRAWITLDGDELHSFCTFTHWRERSRLERSIREANGVASFTSDRDGYLEASRAAESIVEQQGHGSQSDFMAALYSYLDMTVEDALSSDQLVHRALAVLDRRLGKRRLRALELRTDEHPLVRRLLAFRQQVEGLAGRVGAA